MLELLLLGYNLSKEQAEQAAIAIIAKIQAAPSQQDRKAGDRCINDLIPLFWDSFDFKRRIDRIRPKGIIVNYLVPAFGDRPLASLMAKEGLDYVLRRQRGLRISETPTSDKLTLQETTSRMLLKWG